MTVTRINEKKCETHFSVNALIEFYNVPSHNRYAVKDTYIIHCTYVAHGNKINSNIIFTLYCTSSTVCMKVFTILFPIDCCR